MIPHELSPAQEAAAELAQAQQAGEAPVGALIQVLEVDGGVQFTAFFSGDNFDPGLRSHQVVNALVEFATEVLFPATGAAEEMAEEATSALAKPVNQGGIVLAEA